MATVQPRPNISKNDALVVHIVKQLCISVTGLSDGRYELGVILMLRYIELVTS